MLARVTTQKSGIIEYLENGLKSGQNLSRDEIDRRVTVDGNLEITGNIIAGLNDTGRDNNYLHITLGFSERGISEDEISKAYYDYKELLFSSYSEVEYNVYSEIHMPKIKSFNDRKTGEVIERFPHVHMVVPLTNLVTGKSLNPFGLYKSNVKYHDAIQETVNRTNKLQSPYDNQRNTTVSKADLISRYKGDNFKGFKSEFKEEILNSVLTKDIRTMKDFEAELSRYGEVSRGKAGSHDEYLKVKLAGETKNVRLKEGQFKEGFIVQRIDKREKPSDKVINSLVKEWKETRSDEMKYIHPASPKARREYHSLDKDQQRVHLNERRREYEEKNNIRTGRRQTNREHSTQRIGARTVTDIRNGVPSLSQRGVDESSPQRRVITQSLLHGSQDHDLGREGISRSGQLRRPLSRSGRRRGGGLRGVTENQNLTLSPVKSNTVHFLNEHHENQQRKDDINKYGNIKKNIDADKLLDYLSQSHGLIKKNYSVISSKTSEDKITIGPRSYNASDFLTKHMGQTWEDTKSILNNVYGDQLYEKNEAKVINSIQFVSNYVTQGKTRSKKSSRLDESIMILKHLQRKETFGETTMLSDITKGHKKTVDQNNEIYGDKISLKETAENFKRQQELAKNITMKMKDLVVNKDLKNNKVDFNDVKTGEKVFTDTGEKIIMADRKPSIDNVSAAMTLAAEKFGAVNISGSKEFKQQVIDVVIAKNLNVVFKNKDMQADFIEQRNEHINKSFPDEQKNINKNFADEQKNIINKSNAVNIADKPTKIHENESQIQKEVKTAVSLMATSESLRRSGATEKADLVESEAATVASTINSNKNPFDQNDQPMLSRQFEKGMESRRTLKPNLKDTGDSININITEAKQFLNNTDKEPVTIMSHGPAPFLNKPNNNKSYYVELSNGKTEWGIGLKSAIEKSSAGVGDEIKLTRVDSKPVQVDSKIKDSEGQPIKKDAIKVDWDVRVINAAIQPKKYDIAYQWDGEKKAMNMTVNGEKPSKIDSVALKNIVAKDGFLSTQNFKDVQAGSLDLQKANGKQPVAKTVSQTGEIVVAVTQQKAVKVAKV